MSEENLNQPQNETKPGPSFWQDKTVLITLSVMILAGLLTVAWITHRTLKTVENFTRTGLNSTTQLSVFSVAESLHKQSKLVIQSALITVDQSLEKETVLSLGGFAFGLGTSNLRMVSMGNRVQYYIPLNDVAESDIVWDGEKKTLTLKVPAPIVDSDLVEVQQDPRQILFLGEDSWFDWARGSGKSELAQEAKDNLRQYVLRTARTRYYMNMAEDNTAREMERLVHALIAPLEPEARVVVQFKRKH
ncbi:MAG: DUF4230 domain-containing protein [Verrucomicrobia bacterium]|nr:DUF4230 domain-containing protein [Verrucomicrobiota bacterium]